MQIRKCKRTYLKRELFVKRDTRAIRCRIDANRIPAVGTVEGSDATAAGAHPFGGSPGEY
jgi:hypothetical protein